MRGVPTFTNALAGIATFELVHWSKEQLEAVRRRLYRQVPLASHLWARRRHYWDRRTRHAKRFALARDRGAARCDLPIRAPLPGGMEPLPAHADKIIFVQNPLREIVTADGPISLEGIFEVGNSLIAASSGVSEPTAERPAHFFRRRVRLTLPAEPRTTAEPTISQPKSVGSWAVLLVGDRSEINALATYQRLSKKHHAILGGYQPVFIHTSLGVNTGAHWHRVRIEANSCAAADALCSKLCAVGGGCLVQRINGWVASHCFAWGPHSSSLRAAGGL